MTAVEWLLNELSIAGYFPYGIPPKIEDQAKEMEKEQIYSEDEVREMLFMALYEPQEECCTIHTKDSIVRKVLKTFKS